MIRTVEAPAPINIFRHCVFMAKFENQAGPIPGVVDAEYKRIRRRLDDLGMDPLPPEEIRGIKGNVFTGGTAWRTLAEAGSAEEARGLIEAIMRAQVRHLSTDYDDIPKWDLDAADLDELRDDCLRGLGD
jgi:hypothetical protein